MHCTRCGARNAADDRYCTSCGAELLLAQAAPARITGRLKAIWLPAALVVLLAVTVLVVWRVRDLANRVGLSRPPVSSMPTAESRGRTAGAEWGDILTGAQYAQLSALAQGTAFPGARPVVTGTLSLAQLRAMAAQADGKTVHVQGQVIRKTLLCGLQPGLPTAVLLVLDDGTAALPVLCRGSADGVESGQGVNVVGAFSAQGGGISADSVEGVTAARGAQGLIERLARLPVWIFGVAGASVLMLYVAIVWLNHRLRASVRHEGTGRDT